MDDLSSRLTAFQKHTGLTNNAFATKCGINPSNYSKMIRGQQTFTTRSLVKIGDAFRNLNTEWLMTGEGEMLNGNAQSQDEPTPTKVTKPFKSYFKESRDMMVPLIHIDSVGGVHSENLIESSEQYVEQWIPLPDARHGDLAIMQSGDSMSPTIPPGAVLQIRRVVEWQEYFGYGNVFVLWLSDERRITKQVLKYAPDPKNYVTCHSYNPESADEELPKSMIKEVWKVVNVLINKGW